MPRTNRQGKYVPLNPKKIIGNPHKIFYRSSWEKKVMYKFDTSDYILKWGSECVVVPYLSPKDQKWHRYFPDFIIITKKDGKEKVTMIEVKPYNQTKPPTKRGKKKESTYLKEVLTWSVNDAKWAYAEQYCEERGWNFVKMTEKEIFPSV